MKNLCFALALVASTNSFANQADYIKSGDVEAIDSAIKLTEENLQNDERISKDINGFILLSGTNPENQAECEIKLKKSMAFGGEGLSYQLGVIDTDPNSERKNNPHIALDIKSFIASASQQKEIVRSDAYSAKIRTAHTIPFWLGSRKTSVIEINGDMINVSAAFTQSPLNFKSRHFDSIDSREDLRDITFFNYNELRPSDEISCEFALK